MLAGPGHQREEQGRTASDRDRGDVLESVHAIECGGGDLRCHEGDFNES